MPRICGGHGCILAAIRLLCHHLWRESPQPCHRSGLLMTVDFAIPQRQIESHNAEHQADEVIVYLDSLCRHWQDQPHPVIDQDTLSWLQQRDGVSVAHILSETSRAFYQRGFLAAASTLSSVAQEIVLRAEDATDLQKSAVCRETSRLCLAVAQIPLALQSIQLATSWLPPLDLGTPSTESTIRREFLDVYTLYTEILVYMQQWQAAESMARQILDQWSNPIQQAIEKSDVLHILGDMLRQQAEWTANPHTLPEAEERLTESLSIRQRLLPASHWKMAESLHALAFLRRAQGRNDAQQRLLTDASHLVRIHYGELHPEVASLALAQAVCALEEGNPPEALEHCTKAIEIYQHFQLTTLPSVALAHFVEAAVYRLSGQWQMAQEVYLYAQEILQHYPPSSLPFQLRRLQRHDIFSRAIDAFLSLQHEYAYVALQDGQTDKATHHLQQALHLAPTHPTNWALLERTLLQIDITWLISFLADILDQFPGRILSIATQQELASCLPVLQQLMDSYPEHAELASLASSFFRKSGNLDQALLLAKHACRLQPSWRSVIGLALCYEALQQWEDAILNYEVALSDCPDPIPILLDLGDLLRRLQRWEEALRIYEHVLAYQPHHDKAVPCSLYCQAVWKPDPSHLQAWHKYCERFPHNPWLFQLQQEHHG